MKKFIIFSVVFILSACTRSVPSTFYTLTTFNENKNLKLEEKTILGIEVNIPKYLDRPQIITKISDVEMNLSEFDRWIEPLDETVARIISENIEGSLKNIVVKKNNKNRKVFDYVLTVNIQRMEGTFKGNALIVAFWQIEDNNHKVLFSKTSRFEAGIDVTYEDFIRKLSLLFGKLSSEISLNLTKIKK